MDSCSWWISRRTFLRCGAGFAAGASLLSSSCASGPTNRTFDSRPSIRFGIVADCHYANVSPVGTRFYRESPVKLAECVTRMKAERVAFLVELGDLKDQDDPPCESRTLEYLQSIEAVFAAFAGPRYHVLGNHDMDSLSKQQFLAQVENTGTDAARSYYSFSTCGGYLHFVMLDANYTADGQDYDHGNFDWRDANIPAKELDWLKQDLTTCTGPVVVFIHQRLDGTGPVYVKNAAEVRQVLEESDQVVAVFQGHHHEGGYSCVAGIHYYTLPALVEGSGPDNNSYAIVELHSDRSLTVTGCHKAPSIRLPYTARKPAPSCA